ncbi:MAG TPA: peptidylprolyl isomerase [Steroidobacteraceae bacterium]|nr:peptidylprolyl isomerase [Steroidobacteraceae bacterium]
MNPIRLLPVIALVALAACQRAGTGGAEREPAAAPVATVNGKPISRDFFESYLKAAAGKAGSELSAEQREQLLDNLVRAQLVAQQAEKDGVDKEQDTAALLELQRLNLLQQAMSQRYLKDKQPSEQELRAEYETQIAALPRQEYHARHILVATEDFASRLVDRLAKGQDFAELARRESMDGSKENGGDLGWFTPDRMVKPFAEAVATLKPGETTSKPVQTQFGWHVIKLEGTRDLAAPPFDSVRQRLEQMVRMKKFNSYVDELEKQAKVEKRLEEPADG